MDCRAKYESMFCTAQSVDYANPYFARPTHRVYTQIFYHMKISCYILLPPSLPPTLSLSLSLLLQSATTLCDVVSDTWKVLYGSEEEEELTYGSEEEEELTGFTKEEMSVISMISLH